AVRTNAFDPSQPDLFMDIFNDFILHGDPFFYLADFRSYIEVQDRIDLLFRNPEAWAEKAILNVSQMGWFSSDRTIREYAEKVWDIKPIRISRPDTIE
ncbi:MAG: glycogen/starch/alpha-glucan phosphorylase, partial [Pontiellaceae bacterium]|nr:glycogen/starch/alpha-glucan phosphorylase [Pontiellaceae bacterium]